MNQLFGSNERASTLVSVGLYHVHGQNASNFIVLNSVEPNYLGYI